MTDPTRLHSPAAERNRGPILEQLLRLLPPAGLMLEVASGSGQHAAHFARGLPGWRWQPSEGDPTALASIDAWCAGIAGVHPTIDLDVMAADWVGVPKPVDAIFCANLIHISPWPCTLALLRGTQRHLGAHGLLITYGPYLQDDVPTASGNLAFDQDLRQRNPAWGLRRLSALTHAAAAVGLALKEWVSMPANNLLLVFAGTGLPDPEVKRGP